MRQDWMDDIGSPGDSGGFEEEDVVVGVSGSVMVIAPRSVRNMNPGALQAFGELQAAALAIVQARQEMSACVAELRDRGVSWSAIGWATGLTPEAAKKRWAAV
jgi:hypothetical protein